MISEFVDLFVPVSLEVVSCIELHLKHLKVNELPQVLELDRLCFGGLWSRDGYLREMESPNSTLLVVPLPYGGDRLMGLGCLWSIVAEAHITLMAVHPEFQGQGLGQLILWGLLKDGQTRGLERATLEVRESNTAAIALYEKFGFKVAGRRKGYYQATGEDALIMWRKGLNDPSFAEELAGWENKIGDRLKHNHWHWQS